VVTAASGPAGAAASGGADGGGVALLATQVLETHWPIWPPSAVQGSPLAAGAPTQLPWGSHVASLMQLFLGSQGAPAGRAASVHLPLPGSHAATLHADAGAVQTDGGNSQTPNEQLAGFAQAPPGEQSVPLGFAAATQLPVAASQRPSEHAPANAEQSFGRPEQTPF
jgi:hypothetical protein